MNTVERAVYRLVADYSWLRKPLVEIYQLSMSLLPAESFEPIEDLKVIAGCFFGFHDKIPWSCDNTRLLAHRFDQNISIRKVEREPIQIGFLRFDYAFQNVAQSTCWNWQQGSMLQWLGRDGNLAFNDFEGSECIRIFDEHSVELGRLNGHMGSANPDGTKILAYNFGRLKKAAKDYGYQHFESRLVDAANPEEDGLWLLDCQSDSKELIVSLNELAATEKLESMHGAYHYVTHTSYSPDGENYCFLHRWRTALGKLYSRLYVGCSSTNELRFFTLHDVSHISWNGNAHLLIYGWLNRDLPGYISLNIDSMTSKLAGFGIANVDGHPQVNCSGLVVTDSYPNRSRLQSLYVCNPSTDNCYLIQRSKIPHKYKHARRCDFHPRWDRSGSRICFDSCHTGTRAICIIEKFEITDQRFLNISAEPK